ncbi:MAG: PPOX class F420-dependent oxidoreductase [Actinomycetota bacterium]
MDIPQALTWAATQTHGVLITLRKDGRAQSSDVVFTVIDDQICISLTDDRAKTRNMRRDPRVVFHITSPGSWSYASIDATADLMPVTTDPGDATADALVAVYRDVAGEHDDWDEFRAAMIDEGRLVARLTPNSVTGQVH